MSPSTAPAMVARALDLQRWLNTFPGIFVKEDGIPGQRTSDAYKKATGAFFPGTPGDEVVGGSVCAEEVNDG